MIAGVRYRTETHIARVPRVIAILFVLSCALVPLASAGETISMAVAMDPATFDPHGAMHPGAPVLYSYIYDTLIYQDGDGRLVPNLAESWTVSPDGLTVTFVLRRGVRFSNGRPFDSEAVRYTLQRLQRIGRRSHIFTEIENIVRIRVMDAHRVSLELNEPSAPLLSALSYAYAAMLDPVAVERGGAEYGESPVGTGPYVVEEWISGSRVTLVRNSFYGAHRPTDDPSLRSTVDRLNIFFTPHEATREQALLSGELDMAYFTSRAAARRVADRTEFSLMSDAVRGLVYLGFNVESATFSDLRMRRAVAHAVDREEILALVGDGTAVDTLIPPSIPGYAPELSVEAIQHDVRAARELVHAAEYGEEPVRIITSRFPTHRAIATVVQAQLERAGIVARIRVLDFAALRAAAAAGEYDIVLTRYSWNDPDLLRIYLSGDAAGRTNRSAYHNAEFDRLVDLARRESNPDRRHRLYRDAQRIAMDETPWIPLFMPETFAVVHARVVGTFMVNSHVIIDDARVVAD